jgi:hypothetical protein
MFESARGSVLEQKSATSQKSVPVSVPWELCSHQVIVDGKTLRTAAFAAAALKRAASPARTTAAALNAGRGDNVAARSRAAAAAAAAWAAVGTWAAAGHGEKEAAWAAAVAARAAAAAWAAAAWAAAARAEGRAEQRRVDADERAKPRNDLLHEREEEPQTMHQFGPRSCRHGSPRGGRAGGLPPLT